MTSLATPRRAARCASTAWVAASIPAVIFPPVKSGWTR
jgi:hypothetical protein